MLPSKVTSLAGIIMLSLGMLFLAWNVLFTGIQGHARAAAPWWIGDDVSDVDLERTIVQVIRPPSRPLSSGQRSLAIAAARQRPLAAEPYLLLGLDVGARGDDRRSIALLEEARRRNPRLRAARLILLDRYARTLRPEAAATEIKVLSYLIPRASAVLIPALAALAEDNVTGPSVADALRDDPLIDAVATHMVGQGADESAILRLAAARRQAPGQPAPGWQQLLVRAMADQGKVDQAKALWLRFGGAGSQGQLVYDGDFRGRPGSGPFNWVLANGEIGTAELTKGRVLEVNYFGRLTGQLASQLLTLDPGAYRLSFQAMDLSNAANGGLAWQVMCRSGSEPLIEIPLRKTKDTARPYSATFVVPTQACESQWLTLQGTADEFPVRQTFEMKQVSVTRLDR